MIEEPTEIGDLNSWKFMDFGSTGNLRGTDLRPLHVCNRCVVWSFCEAPNSETMACLCCASLSFGNLLPMLDYVTKP